MKRWMVIILGAGLALTPVTYLLVSWGGGVGRDVPDARPAARRPPIDDPPARTIAAENWPAMKRAAVHVAIDKHWTVGVVVTGDLVEPGTFFRRTLEAAPADAPGVTVFRAHAMGTSHSWMRVAETRLTVHSLFVSLDDLVLGAEVNGLWRWRDQPDRPWYVGSGPRALEIGIDRSSDRKLKEPDVPDGGTLVVDGRLTFFVLAGLPDHPRVATDGLGPWPDPLPTPLLNAATRGDGMALCAWRPSRRRDARTKRADALGETFVEWRDTYGSLQSTATLQTGVRRDEACKVFATMTGGAVVPGSDGHGLVLVGRDAPRTLHEGPSSPRLIATDGTYQVAMLAAPDDDDAATTLTVLDIDKRTTRLSLPLPPGMTIQSLAIAGDNVILGGNHRGTITMDGRPLLSAPSDEPTPFYWIIRLGRQ